MTEARTLFLGGDVMTGRGIDQILPHPGDPELHETHVKNATDYVRLAEQAHGSIPRPTDYSYVWGIALDELEAREPELRAINLETSVTRSEDFWNDKGIHYRMHPDNVPCLSEAGIDLCSLANNHVLDWGISGLEDTLRSLHRAGVQTSGAGLTRGQATEPAVVDEAGDSRVLFFSFATSSSGVPENWAATNKRPGVNYLGDLSESTARAVSDCIRDEKRPGDTVILSIHWGGNWGFGVPSKQVSFAHRLIESGDVDLVHGHSSHHVKAIDVHHGHLILYGCGDLLTDYEGIRGHEQYRSDLGCMYFPVIDTGSGRLIDLTVVPTQLRRFQLTRPSSEDVGWLKETFQREGRPFGTEVTVDNHEIVLSGSW